MTRTDLARSVKTATFAAALSLGALAAAPAQAADITLGVTFHDAFEAQPSYAQPGHAQPVHYRSRKHVRHYRPVRRFCRPRRALKKARRLGVRHAFIHRIGPRGTVIQGRRWGRVVRVGIGAARGCPVVHATRRYH